MEGDAARARRAAGAGIAIGVGFMSLTAVLFLTLPEWLSRVFSDDPQVVALAALLLPIAGVFQVVDGLQVVAAGALRGVGDTRVPMILNLVGFWLVGLRGHHPGLFENVRWSSRHALADTLANLGSGRTHGLVETLGDIDDAAAYADYFSIKRGINSTKLQGRKRLSS